MKRIIALSLALLMLFSFAGCKKKDIDPATTAGKNGDRVNYNYNMADYVTLGTYKGMEIDKSSDLYKNYYNSYFENMVAQANAYNLVKEGKLAKNDTAMIEYVGKIDGKEFQGGTSEEEYALTLGSGSFIPGFEDALIGKEVGKTTVINIKFPDDYDQTTYYADDKDMKNGFNLKGKPVEFTVKVNSIRKMPEVNDETAKKLGFKDNAELVKSLEETTVENCITDTFINSKDFAVKTFPETEKKHYDDLYNEIYSAANQEATTYNAQYGTNVTADEMLYYMYGMTADNIKYYHQNSLKNEAIMYAIFDAEKLSYTEEEYNAFLSEIAANNSSSTTTVTLEQVKENYKTWQLEAMMINDVVMKFLAKAAVLK